LIAPDLAAGDKTREAVETSELDRVLIPLASARAPGRHATIGRRWFIGGVATAVVLASTRARGQQPGRIPRIAFVGSFAAAEGTGPDPIDPGVRAFVHELRDLGLIDGRNIIVERRSTEGRIDRLPGLMQEMVGLRVDVIVTIGGPAVWAAHRATDRIAIVGLVDEVLDMGLIDSLARPGHNLTGIGESDVALHGKRLQLLKEAAPSISRVAVISYTQGPNDRGDWRRQLDAAARELRLDVLWVAVDSPEEFEAAFATIIRSRASALYATATHVNDTNAALIADFALKHRLPSFGFPDKGMLLGYDSDERESLRRAAAFVKKILAGAKPGEIPFEQPTTFELVINLKTARVLGLTIPRSMRSRAHELIE
jgi:putative ABC transport system substrate-binding protein